MSDLKQELTKKNRAFCFDGVTQIGKIICPHYRKGSFGMLRCMGSSITGRCGHEEMICPIPPASSNAARKLSDIIEVD